MSAPIDSPRPAGDRKAKTLDAETILDTAADLIESAGMSGFSMRGLADELDVAVTSIYWHVGGRDKLFDRLVDQLLCQMANLPVDGDGPVERIRSLARAQRRVLIDRQHLLAIAHERDRTAALFLPVQQALAGLLADLGVTGSQAALTLRALQVHIISSAIMQFAAVRGAHHRHEEDPTMWDDSWPDQELVEALKAPTDYDAVFEYGLEGLVAPLRQGGQGG